MDLRKILQVGDKVYSPICGRCEVVEVNDYFIVVKNNDSYHYQFHHNGYYEHSVECLLFPSNGCKDWSNFDTLLLRPPKKGEYLATNSGTLFITNSALDTSNRSGVICWIEPNKEGIYIPKIPNKFIYPSRHATKDEIELFNMKLHINGFIFDHEKEGDLERKIIQVLNTSDEELEKIGKNAKKRINSLCNGKITEVIKNTICDFTELYIEEWVYRVDFGDTDNPSTISSWQPF